MLPPNLSIQSYYITFSYYFNKNRFIFTIFVSFLSFSFYLVCFTSYFILSALPSQHLLIYNLFLLIILKALPDIYPRVPLFQFYSILHMTSLHIVTTACEAVPDILFHYQHPFPFKCESVVPYSLFFYAPGNKLRVIVLLLYLPEGGLCRVLKALFLSSVIYLELYHYRR